MTKRKSTPKRVTKNQESYFDAERILDEKKVNGKWLYLIKWTGHDRNGKPWSPDWQPKDNCTQMLLKEWEQEKLRQRKRQEEQRNKENHKEKENREDSNKEGNVMQEDSPVDLQDDKADNKVQMDIDKPDNRITDDNLKQVLDKYCRRNINDDIKRKSQTLGTTIVKKDLNPSHKIIKSLSFPDSKVKLIIANNLSIKNAISGNTMDLLNSSNKNIRGKKYPIPSKSERVSLINLNKRSLEDYNNNNNSTTIKRQRIEDLNRKIIQNEKVEESRISTSSSNVKNKKIPSQTNGSSNKISSDGNLTNPQNIPIYNVPSTQISNQGHVGAIHVNSETIRALNSRKNSSSSLAPKFRPIAAKSTQTTTSSQYSNSSNSVNVHSSSSTGKWSGSSSSNASSSRQNSLSARSASIKNSVPVAKNGVSSGSSQTDKNVPILTTSAQHTSYFHKSYVQSTSVPTSISNNQSVDDQNDQTKVSTYNKPFISTTSEQPNQQQSSNLQNSSTMENNNNNDSLNDSFYQLPLEKLKEPTEANIELWMSECKKLKSLNDTLEKEKLELLKEKDRCFKEANYLKLEVEKRPQSDSEASVTIKKYHESITSMSNKWTDSQNKYTNKCNEFAKLESDHSKLQSEYNQVRKIVMTKHSEVETLKEDLNEKIKELKDLGEENNRLKSDWSRIVRNGVILMREDYHKITKLQNSFQDLINQRSNIHVEISRLRETIRQEVDNMKDENYEDDEEEYDALYQQIENLKLQNKLQEISLRMAEENSRIAEESAKLMLDLKKITVEEILKKYDVPSTFSFSNPQASSSSSSSSSTSFTNLLTKNNNTTSSNNNTSRPVEKSLYSQNRDNQGGNTRRMSGNVEICSVQNNSAQGHVNTNTNILQARNLTTVPNNLGFGNLNVSRNSTTVVRGNPRRLSTSSINYPHNMQNKGAAHSLGVRRSSTTTTFPMEMNVRPTISTTEKLKVTRNPTKSIQQMNYFCEWNFCRRSFDDKIELKKHIKEDHFNSG